MIYQPDFPLSRSPLYVYRSSCVAMLRRYFQMSVELGRLPALLGREFFRSRSDTIRESWFEDAVIYVHDIEHCLESLHEFDQQVIARVVLQEYTHEDAARILHCNERTLRRRLAVGLDVLAQLFLERKLMILAKPRRREPALEQLPIPEETEAAGVDIRWQSTFPWSTIFPRPPLAVNPTHSEKNCQPNRGGVCLWKFAVKPP